MARYRPIDRKTGFRKIEMDTIQINKMNNTIVLFFVILNQQILKGAKIRLQDLKSNTDYTAVPE